MIFETADEALAAARKHWRGADTDLIFQITDSPDAANVGKWAYDPAELDSLRAIAGDEPETVKMDSTENVAPTPPTKREQQKLDSAARAKAKADARDAKKLAAQQARFAKAAEQQAARDAKRAANAEARAKVIAERQAAEQDRVAKREARREAARQRKAAALQRSADVQAARADAERRSEEAAKSRDAERAAREAEREANSRNGVHKPNPGTKLANLWELIDGLAAGGDFPSFRDYKSIALTMDYAVVGSPGTITTGYYSYRVYHDIKSEAHAKVDSAE